MRFCCKIAATKAPHLSWNKSRRCSCRAPQCYLRIDWMDKSPGQRSSASSKFGELDRITQSLDIFSDPTDIFSLVLHLYPLRRCGQTDPKKTTPNTLRCGWSCRYCMLRWWPYLPHEKPIFEWPALETAMFTKSPICSPKHHVVVTWSTYGKVFLPWLWVKAILFH